MMMDLTKAKPRTSLSSFRKYCILKDPIFCAEKKKGSYVTELARRGISCISCKFHALLLFMACLCHINLKYEHHKPCVHNRIAISFSFQDLGRGCLYSPPLMTSIRPKLRVCHFLKRSEGYQIILES